jgi:3-oxoacyl-[acyl-carrier-protein] synthase II
MTVLPTQRRVVVTGIGAVTAAGAGAGRCPDGLWAGVRQGRRGVSAITRFDASAFRTRVAAQVDTFDAADFMEAKQARRLDRFAQFALATSRLALDDAQIMPDSARDETAVYLGSALGGVALAEVQHERYMAGGLRAVDPALALAVFGGSAATATAMMLDLRGPAM